MSDIARQPIIEVLRKLRKRIEQFRTRQDTIGEQNTKAALIDPLLSALGWDIEELDEVCREYKRKPQDNPVDYALFILRSPVLFVEAKGLKGNLSDRRWISQTLGYATVVGVEWCVLTNGDEYRLYNSHAAVDVEEKLFRVVRISDPSQNEYTLDTLDLLSKDKMGENRLEVLWKAHFIDRHVKAALHNLFRNDNSGLIRLIHKKTRGISPAEIRESLKRADVSINFPTTASLAEPPAIQGESPPSFPEESSQNLDRHRTPKMLGVELSDLIQAGLITPPLELEKNFKKITFKATVQEDGRVLFNNELYDSLSMAASMARKSVIGAPPNRKYPQTNGWAFWRYREKETGGVREIDAIRQEYLKMIN